MKPTLWVSFVFQRQTLSQFWEETRRTARCWMCPKLQWVMRTCWDLVCFGCSVGIKGSQWETTGRRGNPISSSKKRETRHQQQSCICEQVTAKVLCFPLLVKPQDLFFFISLEFWGFFCWRFSAGGVCVPLCAVRARALCAEQCLWACPGFLFSSKSPSALSLFAELCHIASFI